MLFMGVALLADLVPWPGLGPGVMQTLTRSLIEQSSSEQKSRANILYKDSSAGAKVSTQDDALGSARNDG